MSISAEASGYQVVIGTPAEEDAQVRLAVQAGLAAVAAEVGRHRGTQDKFTGGRDTGAGDRKGNHVLPCVTSGDERQGSRCGRSARRVLFDASWPAMWCAPAV